MNGLCKLLACAFACVSTVATASDAWPGDRWEIGSRIGGAITDSSFHVDGKVESLSLLRTLGAKRAVEFEFSADQLDFGINFGLEHQTFSVNYLTINREPLWDPYFLVGLGVIRFEAPGAIQHGTDGMAQMAVGGTWSLLQSRKLLFRADLRIRYDFNNSHQPGQDGFGDAIVSMGLSLPLGGLR